MSDWQKVYQDNQEYRAEIVRAVLEDQNLQPVLVNKKDSNYPIGHFEVQVARQHVMKALKIINEEIKFE